MAWRLLEAHRRLCCKNLQWLCGLSGAAAPLSVSLCERGAFFVLLDNWHERRETADQFGPDRKKNFEQNSQDQNKIVTLKVKFLDFTLEKIFSLK